MYVLSLSIGLLTSIASYNQVAVIFPVVAVSPYYFTKQIGLGGLMQVVNAFSYVHNALPFIINAYTDIASWQAVTQRLSRFERRLLEIHESTHAPQRIVVRRGGVGVVVEELDLNLPDEATSALDEPSEPQLYGLLRAAPWKPTVVSVGHRNTLLYISVAVYRVRNLRLFRRISKFK